MFRVTDFGSGKVHIYRSRSIITCSPNGTLTYEPPEVKSKGVTSRPYDLWSLGGVFLEILIWAVFDYQSVQRFAKERFDRRYPGSQTDFLKDDAFWQMDEERIVSCRKCVTSWIDDLKAIAESQDGSPFNGVPDLILAMLDPVRKTRIKALDLWDTLDRLHIQKKADMESAGDASLAKGSVLRQLPGPVT